MYQGKRTKKAVRRRTQGKKSPRNRRRSRGGRANPGPVIVFAVSFLLAAYALSQLVGYGLDNASSARQNEALTAMAVQTVPRETLPEKKPEATVPPEAPDAPEAPVPQTPTEAPRETAPIQVDFQALKAQSQDIIGWLYSPDTPINYPIMRSKNNLDYIRKLPDGTPNDTGSLFLDYRNETDFLTGYSVVYGHNMKNDTMFGTLEEYKDQAYYDAHSVLYLITEGGSYRLDPVSGVVTAGTSDYYDLPMEWEKGKKQVNQSLPESTFVPAAFPESQTYLLLSTCSYEYDDARFILICAVTEIENP